MFFNSKKFNTEIEELKKLRQDEALSPLRKAELKLQVLSKLQNQPATKQNVTAWRLSKWQYYVASFISGLTILSGTAFASNNAKPGDILFPVKKVKENIQLGLTFSDTAKTNLKIEFAQERVQELNQIKHEVQATTTNPSLFERKNHGDELKAQAEVDNAINGLEKEREHFETHGNTTTAAQLTDAITQIKIKVKDGDEDRQSDHRKSKLQQPSILNIPEITPSPTIVNQPNLKDRPSIKSESDDEHDDDHQPKKSGKQSHQFEDDDDR